MYYIDTTKCNHLFQHLSYMLRLHFSHLQGFILFGAVTKTYYINDSS